MRGSLTQRIEELAEFVSEEFLSLQPIATLHAQAALTSDGEQSDLWESSGGRDLLEAIAAQVRSGRAEELDKATMLVAQSGVDGAGARPNSPAQDEFMLEESGYAPALEIFHECLGAAADELISDIEKGRIPDGEELIGKCVQAVHALTAMLAERSGEDVNVDGLLELARDGEDMLMLLQVEQGPKAAEDAVFLMLQLKKEVFARAKS